MGQSLKLGRRGQLRAAAGADQRRVKAEPGRHRDHRMVAGRTAHANPLTFAHLLLPSVASAAQYTLLRASPARAGGAGAIAGNKAIRVKLLCDEMLTRLGRWLRAAGHDTAIAAPGSEDGVLLRQAVAEDRLLLTRDGHLAAHPGRGRRVQRLAADGVQAQARELRDRLGVDWLLAPFTRCVVDNAVLRAATPADRTAAPAGALAQGGPFTTCPQCRRLYWPGSHHRRMRARLEAWNRVPPAGALAGPPRRR